MRKCGYTCASLQLCHHDGDKDIATIPVITRRLKNVFKTSFVRYECLKDVSETACAHWNGFKRAVHISRYLCLYITHQTKHGSRGASRAAISF